MSYRYEAWRAQGLFRPTAFSTCARGQPRVIPNDKTLTRTLISVVQFKTYDPGATSTAQHTE